MGQFSINESLTIFKRRKIEINFESKQIKKCNAHEQQSAKDKNAKNQVRNLK